MELNPTQAGFIKGLGTVVVLAVVSYLASAAHLEGVLNPTLAALAASIFAAIESSLKAKSNGEKGLFGAVSIKP